MFTLKNLISLFRIVLIVPILFFFSDESSTGHSITLSLLIVSYLSDYADGVVARRFKLESGLGLILDPLADKLWTFVMIALLVAYSHLPLWVGLAIVARDITLLIINAKMLRRMGLVMPSDILGKGYMILLGLMVIGMTTHVDGSLSLAYFMVPYAAVTLWNYFKRYIVAMKSDRQSKTQSPLNSAEK